MLGFIASFFTGITASLGLGGGFILLLYLTIFEDMPQLQAQGLNLVFFIPIAALSLVFHIKNKLVEKKPLLPAILCGAAGVGAGAFISTLIEGATLSKIFAVLVFAVGIREVFHKS